MIWSLNERGRWPTCTGENPPRGLPFRAWTIWARGWAIHLRVYRTRSAAK